MKTYISVYFGAFLLAILLVPIVSRLAKKYSLVDDPGPRKVHKIPIPRIGGIAFVISTLTFIVAVFFLDNEIGRSFRQSSTEFITLLAGAGFVFLVGLIDDLRSLRGYTKLICLIVASLAVCASGATLSSISFGSWFEFQTGWAAWPIMIIWIVMITICISVIDGLDGLAAGIAAIVCGTIVCLSLWNGQAAMAVLMLALLGSVTGFLFFNFYPAKIFMGDCGSMFLGFMIGAGSIVCQTKTSTLVGLAVPFLVLGAPILDMGLVIVSRRILERRSMFTPDKNHLHHRLLKLGLHHRAVVIVIYAVTAISASLGLLMLTTDGRWSIELLTGGLLLLFTLLACLHGGRFRKLVKALRSNWAIAKEARLEKHSFENAHVKMNECGTFRSWWDTVCGMGEEMHFKSIGLWKRENGHYVSTCLWNAREIEPRTNKIITLNFPIDGNGRPNLELRASIWTNEHLELAGRQAMLLGRLLDDFPPPEQGDDIQGKSINLLKTEKQPDSSGTKQTIARLRKSANIPDPIEILGIPVVPFGSYDQALHLIEESIKSKCRSIWIAINPIKMYYAWHDPELLDILKQADVGICDGIGVSIASRILYGRSIARCTGCDLFFRLLALADRKQWGIYLLGASSKSNASAREKVQSMYPNIRIVGWQDGYFKDSHDVIKKINASGTKFLFVALGSPRQEYWIWRHRNAIDANVCMGVGGSFDIAAGSLKRAPRIFRVTGTEFLYRLVREPLKRGPIQKVLFPYFCQIMGKKAVDFTLSDEDSEEYTKQEL